MVRTAHCAEHYSTLCRCVVPRYSSAALTTKMAVRAQPPSSNVLGTVMSWSVTSSQALPKASIRDGRVPSLSISSKCVPKSDASLSDQHNQSSSLHSPKARAKKDNCRPNFQRESRRTDLSGTMDCLRWNGGPAGFWRECLFALEYSG